MLILGLQKTTLLDFPHHMASTIFTGGCNFRCPYCHNGDLVLDTATMSAYSEEEIFEHLNKRKNMIDGLAITGGEPTLYPDLPDFIKKVKDLGLLVKLDTNGTNPKMLAALIKDSLVDYVAMDIKHSREKYNLVAQCNSFSIEKIDESISILMEENTDYEFRSTLAKELHSADDIISIGQWIKGAKNYYLQPYRESDQVINPVFSSHTKEELETFVSLLAPYVKTIEIRGLY